jgi:hypothetical protein
MSRTGSIALLIAVVALAITAGTAIAASTRTEYVAQVDPICQAAHAAGQAETKRYARQVRRLTDDGFDPDHPSKALLRAAVKFADRIAHIERLSFAQIAAVTPAPGDEETVTEWLRLRARETAYFQHAFHAFARNQKTHQFRRLSAKADRANLEAESLVGDWEFEHCA